MIICGTAYQYPMFVLSKIFLFFLDPGMWLGALLLIGTGLLWTRWQRTARWILSLCAVFIAVVSLLPVGWLMLSPLEDRFPIIRKIDGKIDGIVVLGGAVQQLVTRYRGQPSLTGGAERMTEFIVLARKHPNARLAFSGGSGLLFDQGVKEADTARLFMAQFGLDVSRIVFEAESRNTYENAVFTWKKLKPKPGERWLLITSASHMPRSVGAFRKAGWDPIAYPVDFLTFGSKQLSFGFNMLSGLNGLRTGLREWAALVVYRLLGRTDAFFPAPKESR
ncbi:MAG: YdcF family protein [Rhodospirillaceae bacterium]|nr:YdcF family protein [Rhodospirillaceae bacterium]